jgi:hypothetical protein
MGHKVIITNKSTAVGAKNRIAEFSNSDDAKVQFRKWIMWLDAREISPTKFIDEDGYVIQLNLQEDIDYDTHN